MKKNTEIMTIKKGTGFMFLGLSLDMKMVLKIDIPSNAGAVPIPKNNIKIALSKGSPVAIAPAAAIYTSPQGKKPLINPIMNFDVCLLDFKKGLMRFLIKLINLKIKGLALKDPFEILGRK